MSIGLEVIRLMGDTVARDGMTIVEIGARSGGFSIFWAEIALKYRAKLFCVDWFRGTDSEHVEATENDPEKYDGFAVRTELRRALNGFGECLDYFVLPFESAVAARLFDDYTVDIVFIDAEHVYDGVKRDLVTWMPKVRQGGVISGHDYEAKVTLDNLLWPVVVEHSHEGYTQDGLNWHCGVIRAVGEMFRPESINESQSIWWVCL
jgi:hypothetical protein